MKYLVALILSLTLATPALAADWDARTRRTNTSVQDADIQNALAQGLPPQFAQAFPSKRFGIYVLVDHANVPELGQGVDYISLGLCKRRPDGSYDLPTATFSTMLPVGNGNADHERQLAIQRLIEQSREFAQLMLQNASRIR